MPEPRQLRRGTTRLLSVVMVGLGVAIVARTLAAGGGPLAVGVLLGLLFIAAGVARLYLQSRMDRR
jgi:hypothetical protein